ncbi:MAG: isochorismatase family protein, partial [Hydrogenophaga sp.]|nr:isochorismatase family protein [Hydrogenophaga sp.]
MTASNTALLVIDVQESFRHRPYWRDEDVVDFLSRQQALIDGAKAAGHAVVQIFHTDDDAEFRLDSGFVTTLAGLRIEPDVIIHKTRHSAFVGTPLEIWLRQRGIGRLIV